jgi:ABC-type branched-subunit amino acid transport system substrate-binding protein
LSRRDFVRLGSAFRAGATFLALAAVVAVAGCNSARMGGGGFGSGPEVRSNAPITGEVLGTGPVRVALLLPLSATGNAGQIAQNFRNAAELALRDFKTAGITVLLKDDQGTAEGARAAASLAISEGAELILGPLFNRSVTAVATVARSSNVPVIAFSSDTSTAGSGLYLLSFLPQSDVDRVVTFAAARGKKSVVALLPNNAYGTVAEAALQRAVANAGGRVMAVARYELDKTSMETQAASAAALVKSGTIDTIFMPDAGDAVPFLAQVLAAGGVAPDKITYLGSGQWDNDQRITAESNLNGAWFPAPDGSGFATFSRRYQAAFGSPPSRTASLAYDATSLAAGLASRFGEQRFSSQTLTNANGFIGIDGAFRFLPNGLSQRGLAVYQINRGTAEMIDPAPKSFTRAPGT